MGAMRAANWDTPQLPFTCTKDASIALWLCVSPERVYRRTEMTNEQLNLVVGAPLFFNAVLIGLLMAYINAKFGAIDKRFDDMRDLWRSELHRVEEVIDARLKHLEER